MRLGLITYQHPHLKTEQVLQRLLSRDRGLEAQLYALPFTPRKGRKVLRPHRPDQSQAASTRHIAERYDIPYLACESDRMIDDHCDIYLVLGAGILSAECIEGKRIVNCHPGVIPACRGLDSFKWAIHDMKPLGITLHYIDAEVDAGELIAIVPTDVYPSDSIASLARRHYENEIEVLSRFDDYRTNPSNPFAGIEPGEPRMRMPLLCEKTLEANFEEYVRLYGGNHGEPVVRQER